VRTADRRTQGHPAEHEQARGVIHLREHAELRQMLSRAHPDSQAKGSEREQEHQARQDRPHEPAEVFPLHGFG
jgi:hypothetical protein